ncbi:MAG: hypothetical protein KIT34_15510 [Cyanobacteria bacterium TGS_CYA1]|nr:hypothetical protein [Cyanobacteria bacterium TGS_CYA1]
MLTIQRKVFLVAFCILFAAATFSYLSAPAHAQKQEKTKATQLSIFNRKEAVFKTVDDLRLFKKPTVDQIEKLINRPLDFSHGGQYETKLSRDEDIVDFEAPYDDKLHIRSVILSVNKSLPITLDDVVNRFGKYSKTAYSKGNEKLKISPERIYFYKKKQVAFRFSLSKIKILTSISIYFD